MSPRSGFRIKHLLLDRVRLHLHANCDIVHIAICQGRLHDITRLIAPLIARIRVYLAMSSLKELNRVALESVSVRL
jgi:hypothetical protein